MTDVMIYSILLLLLIIITVIVHFKTKKRHAEMVELTRLDIKTSQEVVEALRENTKAIDNGNHQISRGELIDLLKDAWIADQRDSNSTVPFIEWLAKEVSNE